jgi:cofilin
MAATFDQECIAKFNAMKLEHKIQFIVYRIDGEKIVIEKEQIKNAQHKWADFVAALPPKEPRYAIYDMQFEQASGDGQRSKLLFISWAPENAPVKSKMMHTQFLIGFKNALVGLAAFHQATDLSEIDYQFVVLNVSRGVK